MVLFWLCYYFVANKSIDPASLSFISDHHIVENNICFKRLLSVIIDLGGSILLAHSEGGVLSDDERDRIQEQYFTKPLECKESI